jgi:EAL domain-containing protein (putative c-di-GMP-specific phosphodiesterase class I)
MSLLTYFTTWFAAWHRIESKTVIPTQPIRVQPALRHTPAAEVEEARIIASIRPHFQPIVSSHNHKIYALEALLRLPGVAMSDTLFRRWEATGEVVYIDTTMVRRVRGALAERSAQIAVTVNASALTVALAPETYLAEIKALAHVAARVIVEVTETFPVLDMAALARFANQCRALGVDLALDDCTPHHDFCTPDALLRVRPAIVKIDGPFFNACYAKGDHRPVADLIDLAQSFGAAVVAEHVASAELRDWAVSLGATLLQGYYFGAAKRLHELLPGSFHQFSYR